MCVDDRWVTTDLERGITVVVRIVVYRVPVVLAGPEQMQDQKTFLSGCRGIKLIHRVLPPVLSRWDVLMRICSPKKILKLMRR